MRRNRCPRSLGLRTHHASSPHHTATHHTSVPHHAAAILVSGLLLRLLLVWLLHHRSTGTLLALAVIAPQARMNADVVSTRTCFSIANLLRDTLRTFNSARAKLLPPSEVVEGFCPCSLRPNSPALCFH